MPNQNKYPLCLILTSKYGNNWLKSPTSWNILFFGNRIVSSRYFLPHSIYRVFSRRKSISMGFSIWFFFPLILFILSVSHTIYFFLNKHSPVKTDLCTFSLVLVFSKFKFSKFQGNRWLLMSHQDNVYWYLCLVICLHIFNTRITNSNDICIFEHVKPKQSVCMCVCVCWQLDSPVEN